MRRVTTVLVQLFGTVNFFYGAYLDVVVRDYPKATANYGWAACALLLALTFEGWDREAKR